MKITEVLAEEGLHSFKAMHISDAPKIWVVTAGSDQIEVWGRGKNGFQVVANATRDEGIEAFVEEFLEWLYAAREQDTVERIILIASSEMLAALRNSMPTDMLACTAAEIPKDLIARPKSERKEVIENMFYL